MKSSIKTYLSLTLLLVLLFAGSQLVAQEADSPGRDEYLYAKKLFEEKYYDLAAEQLERCLRDFPGLREADEAQFLLGQAYLLAGDPERARAAFLRTAIVYAESPRAPEALFKVGESLEIAGRAREAAQAYERVQGFYAGSQLAPEALSRASMLSAAAGDTAHADDVAGKIIEKYPDSPAAARARLDRAERLAARGDYRSAGQYLDWVTSRSGVDSLASEAWVRKGRIDRSRFNLSGAEEYYQNSISLYPATLPAANARLELADLHNMRGSYLDAKEIVTPLLTNSNPMIRGHAMVKLGDAAYLGGEYELALSWYDSAGTKSSLAALKGAWTAEVLGRRKSALDRYLKLANGDTPEARQARIRAAVTSMDLGSAERSATLWQKLLEQGEAPDSIGRAWFELARARAEARIDGVIAAIDRLRQDFPRSPYADDGLYLAAQSALRRADYQSALKGYMDLLNEYPASEFCDSAETEIEFINNFHLRGEKLIERMAELSSLPQNRTNPVRWALDWGDFYFDEFKDPVKAVDQYDRVLDDIIATTDDRIYALYRSGMAYQLLADAGRKEKDRLSFVMYSDSARSRLSQLQRLDPQGSFTLKLGLRLFNSDARLVDSGAMPAVIVARRFEELIARFGEDSIPPATIVSYLPLKINADASASNLSEVIQMANRTASRSAQEADRAALKAIIVDVLVRSGSKQAAVDSAKACAEHMPLTLGAAVLTNWLMKDSELPPLTRYNYLQRFRRLYPYSTHPEEELLIEADLLDALDRPIEALTARRKADALAAWGRPTLDILELPPPGIRLERAIAFRRAGDYPRAAEELSIILNIEVNPDITAKAIYQFALVEKGRQNPQGALTYLDTLTYRYADSPEAGFGRRLLPELLISMGNYEDAAEALVHLQLESQEPDSLYSLSVRHIVCLYRLSKFEEARKEATDLYKKYKDRQDLDQSKALFYLEKGRALDRDKKYADAREQYTLIRDKLPLTVHAPAASYAIGLSFVTEGRYAEGAKQLERFLADYPENELAPEAWLSLGLAQYQLEKYSEAVASLKKVWDSRDAAPYWQQTFEALSKVYRNLRFFDAAIRLNRDYLARFPDAPDLLDRRMEIAQSYLELKEWDEAIRQYRPLLPLADAEREAEIQYYIGEACLGKGDFRSAILEFLKVKILGRKTKLDWGVTAIYQAGFCYEKLGDSDGAARMYKKIIEETGAESNYGRAAQQKLDALPTSQATSGGN